MSTLRPFALVLGVALALSACDSTQETTAGGDLTAEEVTEVTQILADAVAEDTGGLFASASDATAAVADDGLGTVTGTIRGRRDGRQGPCRSDAALVYDARTGTHTATYACNLRTVAVQRTYAATLSYQFRDASGGFIPRPSASGDLVSSIAFRGGASGETRFTRGDAENASTFEQSGQWSLVGLNAGRVPASFTVTQQRTGTHSRSARGRSSDRTFTTRLSGRNILITQGSDGQGASAVGQLAYTTTITVTRAGETETREVQGTIDLEDNGRALMRVFGVPQLFRLSLGDGTVTPA